MKIEFRNVQTVIHGCDCCNCVGTHISEGPFIVTTDNEEVSVEEHASIAFGSIFCRVIGFDHEIIEMKND